MTELATHTPDTKTERTPRLDQARTALQEMGLDRLSSDQMHTAYDNLTRSLRNRWEGRIPGSYPDRVTTSDLKAIPYGSAVLALNLGGTSQVTSHHEKIGGAIVERELNTTPIAERGQPITTENFIHVISDHIMAGVAILEPEERKKLHAVGISVGFAVSNVEDAEYGLGARLTERPQNWPLTDFDPKAQQPNLGRLIIDDINDRYGDDIDLQRVYTQHDSKTTGHDLPLDEETESLPLSIVLGTGTGAQINGQELGISSVTDVFQPSQIVDRMVAQGYIPFANKDAIRARLGGQRTKFHVAAAMEILAEEGLMEKPETAQQIAEVLQYKENGPILSDMASGAMDVEAFNKLKGINGRMESSVSEEDYEMLKLASTMALEQAGDMAGVLIAATLDLAEYDGQERVVVPVAGSFVHKAFGVQNRAQETIKTLLPESDVVLRKACDRRGAANLALKREFEKAA